MIAILVLLVVIGGVTSLVATVIGFSPAGELVDFSCDSRTRSRQFAEPAVAVLAAYSAAAGRTPGMRVVDQDAHSVLVDLRPTVRIMDGNFGMAIRVTAHPEGGATQVHTEARHKVPWAGRDHNAALRSAEAALRKNAKLAGLRELF